MILGNVLDILGGFSALGSPNCGGVIADMHIAILALDHLAFINRKDYFSTVLQVLVGHHEPFADISVGWSGKVHDTSIFKNTGLFRTLQQGLFSRQEDTIRDFEMSVVILGDPV